MRLLSHLQSYHDLHFCITHAFKKWFFFSSPSSKYNHISLQLSRNLNGTKTCLPFLLILSIKVQCIIYRGKQRLLRNLITASFTWRITHRLTTPIQTLKSSTPLISKQTLINLFVCTLVYFDVHNCIFVVVLHVNSFVPPVNPSYIIMIISLIIYQTYPTSLIFMYQNDMPRGSAMVFVW